MICLILFSPELIAPVFEYQARTNLNYYLIILTPAYHDPISTSHNASEAMQHYITRFLILAVLSMPLAGQAASPLGPPIAEFFKNENRIAHAVIVEKLPGDKISIRVDAFLFQNDDELVNLKVDDHVFADVEVGKEYVLVFSRFRKNRLVRDEWEVNPEGPALIEARGLGTPAIYANNAAILTLLTPPDNRDELSKDTETSMLLSLAENDGDGRAKELAIFELYLRNDLQGAISGNNAERYAALTMSAVPRLKNFLLQGARTFPEKYRTPWLGQEYRKVVAAYGTELDLNSDVPLLVKNSLSGLGKEGTVDDLEMIGTHLYSNAPGVARAALQALDAIDPRKALTLAQQAVQSDQIHVVTRRELTSFIEQYADSDAFN